MIVTGPRSLSAGVGVRGPNRPADVLLVQSLLNKHRPRIDGAREIPTDGIIGPKTIATIKTFQRVIVKMRVPDGQVDPNGRTIAALLVSPGIAHATPKVSAILPVSRPLRFPLRNLPAHSYKTGARYFGAPRDGGKRRHAGCDLLAGPGTEILAMADGEVHQNMYFFYMGTNALEVRHGEGWIARYGEIASVESGIVKGAKVKRGQVIARVGRLDSGSSMLHLEVYSGAGSGNLTVRGNQPFQRRGDLADPTLYLDAAVLQ